MHCHLQPWQEFGIVKVLLMKTGFLFFFSLFLFFFIFFMFLSLLFSLKILEDTKKIDKIILLIWNFHFIDYVILFTGI